jgi:type IV pilus assembly protein PilB
MSTIDPLAPAASAAHQESKENPSGAGTHSSSILPARPMMTSFMEHLVRNGTITEEVALKATALKNQQNIKDKRSVTDILVDEFGISRDILHREVARFYSFRVIDYNERGPRTLPPHTVDKLLKELPDSINRIAIKHKVLPYETAEGQPDKLLVVTPNPSDREVYDVARTFPYKKFEICFMSEKDWAEYWRRITLNKAQAVTDQASSGVTFEEDDAELDNVLDKEINSSELISTVENIFTDAVRVGASDIHVIPRGPRRTDICFRIDGQLSLWHAFDDSRAEAVVAVVKGKGMNLDRFERMAAQDGSSQKVVDNQVIRFRMSVLPIISQSITGKFESVVIRILKDANASVSLRTIGFDPYSLQVFQDAIEKPHGIVILTGPTGSGKSTTLVAALRSVMKPTLNTITVEDPVEYLIEGARQVKLNHKLDFEGAMRAILRHDPDIVMLGEIRDRITADIAIKLANTGHLTFSTLHTNDAPSAISRLFKMGVEPFLIAQALNIVVAQRLVRKLCEKCKEPDKDVARSKLERMGFTKEEAKETIFMKPVGCAHCVEGFKGRTAIHESLYITHDIRELIINSNEKIDLDAIKQEAVRHGMQTLRRSAIELVKRGVTTLEEGMSSTTND